MPKKRRIGLMLEVRWPVNHHLGVFSGVQRYAMEQGWQPIIDEFADDTMRKATKHSPPYDGVIARVNRQLSKQSKRLGLPVVNVWQSSPVADMIHGVFPDCVSAANSIAEHLVSRGLREFAALWCRGDESHKIIADEFQSFLKGRGFDCSKISIPITYTDSVTTWRKTEQTVRKWLDGWALPVGVYIGDETIGRMVVQMCHERGWRVPEDVAIVTGRNETAHCESPKPSLTSVEFQFERIGYEAARLLDQLMKERDKQGPSAKLKSSPTHLLLPPQGLVLRESTDFYAVDDELVASALSFIAGHFHQPIGQHDVARAVSAETRTLQRRFRKHLNRPIAAEIRRVRLERARRELAQSDHSIAHIARMVGFGESKRMHEIFRRELGIAPSDYRNQRLMRKPV